MTERLSNRRRILVGGAAVAGSVAGAAYFFRESAIEDDASDSDSPTEMAAGSSEIDTRLAPPPDAEPCLPDDPWGGGVRGDLLDGPPPLAPGVLPPYLTPVEDHYLFHSECTPAPRPPEEHVVVLSELGGLEHVRTWPELMERLETRELVATTCSAANGKPFEDLVFPRTNTTWTRWPWRFGGIGTHRWTVVSVADLLESQGFSYRRSTVVVGTRGGVTVDIPMALVRERRVLLAVAANGVPMPHLRGGPARLILPGQYGRQWLKWVNRLELTDEYAEDAARGMEEFRVRPLAFCSTHPTGGAAASPLVLGGVAFAGDQAVERVEISGLGPQPLQAELVDPALPDVWTRWRAEVQVAPGTYQVRVSCVDRSGRRTRSEPQPERPGWDADHRFSVTVA